MVFTGRNREENENGLRSKSNHVNEEYLEAIRTNSFMEMYSKIQSQLGGRRSLDKLSSPPSSLTRYHLHLSDIVEPSQEFLTDIVEGSQLHHFLSCFFQISFQASKICELLLKSIHQTRANYRAIGRVTKQKLENGGYTNDQCKKIYAKLAAFSSLTNPLSNINSAHFEELHDNLYLSLDIFTSQCRKMRRRRKILKWCKRIAGGALIAVYSALMITLIALAIHSLVGMMAAPGLIGSSVALIAKKKKKKTTKKQGKKILPLERLESQLDTAAKGAYLLINDFDTMSRLVMRLNNEIQHGKFIADLCLRRRTNEMLKEVMRELQINHTGLMSHLEDLEEHVYLCILNINRSRRLVAEKMGAG